MHRFIPDPAAPARETALDPAQLAAVKDIVRDLLRLPRDTAVRISETPRADAVFPAAQPARRWRLNRPRAALTKLMLSQTLATPPEAVTTPPRPPALPALDGAVTLHS